MEGKFYLCSWSYSNGRYTITLKSDPKVAAGASTFEEAEEAFCMLLGDRFGDGEPVTEYDRPPPRSALQEQYSHPEIVEVRGCIPFEATNAARLFSGSLCRACQRRPVRRTAEAVECRRLFGSADGAIALIIKANAIVKIYSEGFIALLSDEERSVLNLRPVIQPPRRRKRFLELVGRPIATHVGVPRFPGLMNRKCKVCGLCGFGYLHEGRLYNFIALQDLPSPVPGVFVIQSELGDPALCMTRTRYEAIVGKSGAQGIISRPVYVVRDDGFIRDNDEEVYPEDLCFKLRPIEDLRPTFREIGKRAEKAMNALLDENPAPSAEEIRAVIKKVGTTMKKPIRK